MICSGQDGTVRVWNISSAAKNQAFLQQTCVFNTGEEISSSDLDRLLLGHVAWNSTGKLLAASMDNMINIWQLAGMSSAISATAVFFINQFLICPYKFIEIEFPFEDMPDLE